MQTSPEIVVIAHNIRSTYNIGAIFRTSDGFGVKHVYLSGYSPHPSMQDDTRLLHIHQKLTRQIHKTALGAEETVSFSYEKDPHAVIKKLQNNKFHIVALEQSEKATSLPNFKNQYDKIALLLGEEVHGITSDLLDQVDEIIEIPMRGQKESFNVSVAYGIALYHISCVTPIHVHV